MEICRNCMGPTSGYDRHCPNCSEHDREAARSTGAPVEAKRLAAPRGKDLAEEHANWFIPMMRKVYVDAMVHGYGHGYEDAARHLTSEGANKEVGE